MAYTESDLTAIKRAIASGRRRVTFGDRTVEYHSMSELIDAKNLIESELLTAEAATVSGNGRLRKIKTTGF